MNAKMAKKLRKVAREELGEDAHKRTTIETKHGTINSMASVRGFYRALKRNFVRNQTW